jgi:hypothetical protein
MKYNIEFIKAIQDWINNDPEMPEEKRKALETSIVSLKKDRRMDVLKILAPFFGEIGKMIFQHHEHR